ECDYTITRIWTATDDCGNTTHAVQIITVQPGDESDMPQFDLANQVEIPAVSLTAFPNPTATRTQFTFELPFESRVRLEVFNMDGKLMQAIYEGDAFANQEYWFQYDVSGLASGIYLYKLTTNEGAYVEKLMIAR
ncbi:MAG: T9SS C-terminal target domain-containing protein, partial [Cryomorphaceae bacterium]